MTDYIIKHFYTISCGIISVCFVAYLGWRTFLKQRRIQASDKFRNTITTEFSKLYPDGILHIPSNKGGDIVKMLRSKHHIISVAVNSYRPHVRNKKRFDKAWDNFTGIGRFRNNEEEPRYNQYSFKNIQGSHFYDYPRKMFIENTKKLLEFASKS